MQQLNQELSPAVTLAINYIVDGMEEVATRVLNVSDFFSKKEQIALYEKIQDVMFKIEGALDMLPKPDEDEDK